jgi:S-adenosylmethionine decarboxylase proenzyme
VPQSLYTSKLFDTARVGTSNSRWMVLEEGPQQCSTPPEEEQVDFDDDEVHLPKGQHYLLDIRNVDSAFLASEVRLVETMIEVIYSCGLTLLSYHCHGLLPTGVSCVGVLLESHVSFHTWPSQGVIAFDLFTCGAASLLPIAPTVERLFSVPQTSIVNGVRRTPESVWAYKMRGFGGDSKDTIEQLSDLFSFPLGAMTQYKKEVRNNGRMAQLSFSYA